MRVSLRGIPEAYISIWDAVRRIPRGSVSTYGIIARLAGREGQARFTGYALHALPEGNALPWHRVINARGGISFPPGSEAAQRQRRLLQSEGVIFRNGRIDLNRHLWPRSERKRAGRLRTR